MIESLPSLILDLIVGVGVSLAFAAVWYALSRLITALRRKTVFTSSPDNLDLFKPAQHQPYIFPKNAGPEASGLGSAFTRIRPGNRGGEKSTTFPKGNVVQGSRCFLTGIDLSICDCDDCKRMR